MLAGPVRSVSFEVTTPYGVAYRGTSTDDVGSWNSAYRAVQYFTSERDGPDVVRSVLGRQPANLTDEQASIYADPAYDTNDNLLGTLKKIGGPVDVAGGWFDAGGGYEKFAYTASYADALMLIAARDFPGSYPALQPEAEFGLQWITKLWNPVPKVLYAQVGIGNGNASNTIQGDYNVVSWPSVEPADDYTAASLFAFALGGAGLG